MGARRRIPAERSRGSGPAGARTTLQLPDALRLVAGYGLELADERDSGLRVPPCVLMEAAMPSADCLAAGEVELASELVPSEESPVARSRHSLATSRAMLAEARGDLETAGRLYDEAARGWREYGFALEQAHALLGAGRCAWRSAATATATATSPLPTSSTLNLASTTPPTRLRQTTTAVHVDMAQ